MPPIRVGVIGAGHFGSRHAQNYATLDTATLVAVCDTDAGVAAATADRYGGTPATAPEALLGQVDAVSIATPTANHHALGRLFLDAGIGVLIEKPMTSTVDEADDLIAAAARTGAVLQIGHLERFNPAFEALRQRVDRPRFIESRRVAPYRARGTDVSVVLDLMIHDLDLVLAMTGAAPERLEAVGTRVFSPTEDLAQAHLWFADGCTACVTASRLATATERSLRVVMDGAVLAADLGAARLMVSRAADGDPAGTVSTEEQSLPQANALARQLDSFVTAVRTGTAPVVRGEDGRRALAAAQTIRDGIADQAAPPA